MEEVKAEVSEVVETKELTLGSVAQELDALGKYVARIEKKVLELTVAANKQSTATLYSLQGAIKAAESTGMIQFKKEEKASEIVSPEQALVTPEG
jgi:hypothetical protein